MIGSSAVKAHRVASGGPKGTRNIIDHAFRFNPIETSSILGRAFYDDACSHTQSMSQITAFGNPPNASLH
jgi:hypothetical protein